jgi:hypothetical protein
MGNGSTAETLSTLFGSMLRIFPLRRPRAAFCSPGTCAPSAKSRLHSAGVCSPLAWVQHASLLSSWPLLLSASSGWFSLGEMNICVSRFCPSEKKPSANCSQKIHKPDTLGLVCTKSRNVLGATTNIRDLLLLFPRFVLALPDWRINRRFSPGDGKEVFYCREDSKRNLFTIGGWDPIVLRFGLL